MKYIEKVILKNFQSHKNTTVEFENGLNVILGPSDSGKTAILRGIRWVLYNEPSGDYFIREGETECSVMIVFSDGFKVKRIRNKSKNSYILYDRNDEETRFEGFGTNIPEEIVEKTSIKKIMLDSENSSSINISEQLDGPFLLSEKTSVRANSIGRLVGVNLIDDALREALKDNRNLSMNKKHVEENIYNLKEELKTYDYLNLLEEKIKSIEVIRNKIDFNQNKIEKLISLQTKYNEIKKDKETLQEVVERLGTLSSVIEKSKEIELKLNRLYILGRLYKSINTIIDEKAQTTTVLNKLINLESAEEKYNQASQLINIKEKYRQTKNKLDKISMEILSINKILIKTKDNDEVYGMVMDIEQNINKLNKLNNLNIHYNDINKRIAVGQLYVDRLKIVDNIYSKYMDLEIKLKSLEEIKGVYNNYVNIVNEKKEATRLVNSCEASTEEILSKYKDLLLKQEVCPVCFSEIDEEKIDHIINHYN